MTIRIPSDEYDAYVANLLVVGGESPEIPNGVSNMDYPCPRCGEICSTSGFSTTLVGYLSPPGHDHDDNCRHFSLTCPKGHKFTVRARNTCSACDWKGKEVCSTCGYNIRKDDDIRNDDQTQIKSIMFVYEKANTSDITELKGETKLEAGYFFAPYKP